MQIQVSYSVSTIMPHNGSLSSTRQDILGGNPSGIRIQLTLDDGNPRSAGATFSPLFPIERHHCFYIYDIISITRNSLGPHCLLQLTSTIPAGPKCETGMPLCP